MNIDSTNLQKMANIARANALRMIRDAKSGHLGIVMGAADIVTLLYAVLMNPQKDKFVLSAGHGSALLYAILDLCGYDIDDTESFRRLGGLPGHPEFGIHGVYATTGPLGQGVANAVGMAIAKKHIDDKGKIYCLCSDGDLMEGVAQEAIAFAGRYKLDNLVLIWDNNGISIDGTAQNDIDVKMRMRAAGWTVRSANGHDFDAMYDVMIEPAPGPLFVACDTIIGLGTSVAKTAAAHGLGIGNSEINTIIRKLDSEDGKKLWHTLALENHHEKKLRTRLTIPNVATPQVLNNISTREMSSIYLQQLLAKGIRIILGSADLGHNTGIKVPGTKEITFNNFSGNYINYGVREHAMAAIMNGMAYMGLRSVGSTFLVFSDYMRPAIRLAALSELPVIYVFSHDSVAVGQDGPTHQPIEQIPGLRLIPNMNVFRPCNMAETAYAWRTALSQTDRPSCIILTRQKIGHVGPSIYGDISDGGYLVYKSKSRRIRVTLIATGSEVPLAVSVARRLNIGIQVASIPSVSDFRESCDAYKKKILRGRVIAIEACATPSWFEFADDVIGIDEFGISGPGDLVYSEYGFDVFAMVNALRAKIKNV